MKSKEIVNDLIEGITSGAIPKDSRLPSETQLGIRYECNRHTIRKVLEGLIERGYLRKVHGGPTFVNTLPSDHSLNLSSLCELYGDDIVKSKIIKFKKETASLELCSILKIKENSKVWVIKRIRYVSGSPSHMEETYMPYSLFPDLTQNDCEGSLLQYVEHILDYEVSHAIKNINAVKLSNEECSYLNLPNESLALQIENTGYLTNDRVYEYSINKHRDNNITYYAKR